MELQNIKKGEGALATMQNVRLELVIAGPWYVVYRKYPHIVEWSGCVTCVVNFCSQC